MERRTAKPLRFFLLQISISFLVTLFVLALTQNLFFSIPPLKSAELSLIDLRFRQRDLQKKNKDIVVVNISSESYTSLPARWPWPTSYYTRLIRNLTHAGAKVIGLDVIFPPAAGSMTEEDREFHRTLHESANVVLAGKIKSEETKFTLRQRSPSYGNRFIDTLTRFGIVNLPLDIDDVRRRYMPFIFDEDQEERLPTFSMAVLNAYYNQPNNLTADLSGNAFLYGQKVIPLYDATSFLINYYGPDSTFPRVDIVDVLDDSTLTTVDEERYGSEINSFDNPEYGVLNDSIFANKIVIVGSTDPEDKDLFLATPSKKRVEDRMMYGVEIHANVIQSIIDGNFIRRQPLLLTFFTVFGLCLFTYVLTAGLKSIRTEYSALIEVLGVALILSELFIIYWASVQLFQKENYLTDMTSPALAVILSYVSSTVYSYVSERRQKILIKGMFSQYVNPTIVDELVAHPERLRLGGERKEVTVFFSDIENFTQIAEKIQPENLVTILNDYLSEMTAIIITNNGTLDKYEGDAIVAFWGAPLPQDDHAIRACRAAVQMQRKLEEIRPLWEREGKPPLRIRIGMSTGEVVVGNMGGANRFDYTVIGDTVNLGSRLEGANKQYKTRIMISGSTYKYAKDFIHARELDLLVVAGKTEPIRVYELVGLTEEKLSHNQEQFLRMYSKGLMHYRQREWQTAIGAFERALDLYPDDYPCQLYVERSDLYRSTPPPDDWNGVFILRTK